MTSNIECKPLLVVKHSPIGSWKQNCPSKKSLVAELSFIEKKKFGSRIVLHRKKSWKQNCPSSKEKLEAELSDSKG